MHTRLRSPLGQPDIGTAHRYFCCFHTEHRSLINMHSYCTVSSGNICGREPIHTQAEKLNLSSSRTFLHLLRTTQSLLLLLSNLQQRVSVRACNCYLMLDTLTASLFTNAEKMHHAACSLSINTADWRVLIPWHLCSQINRVAGQTAHR